MREHYSQQGPSQQGPSQGYRNESERQQAGGSQAQDYDRPRQRSFEDYPEQQFQQGPRGESSRMEYQSGGRGEYSQQGGWSGREPSPYRSAGGYGESEAYQPGSRQQQGYGGESGYGDYGYGDYGQGRPSTSQGYQRGRQEGRSEQGGRPYGQQAYGGEFGPSGGPSGFGSEGYGGSQGYAYGSPSSGSSSYGQQQSGPQFGQFGGQPGQIGRTRKGPKDYIRSDERLREAVCERLSEESSVDVSEVSVDVKNGCVTLEGTVPERRMKYAIEDVADSCWGVKDVENHVRVQSSRFGEEAASGQRSAASASSGSTKGSEQTKGRGKEEQTH